MTKSIIVFFITVLTAVVTFAQTANLPSAKPFSFAGHVTLKNDVPEPIQITMFEGDFQQAPDDEDTTAMKQGLAQQGVKLDSEIFYSLKDNKPNLLIMLISVKAEQNILIIDLEKQEKFLYNVSEIQDGKIISRKQGFSDYHLVVSKN